MYVENKRVEVDLLILPCVLVSQPTSYVGHKNGETK